MAVGLCEVEQTLTRSLSAAVTEPKRIQRRPSGRRCRVKKSGIFSRFSDAAPSAPENKGGDLQDLREKGKIEKKDRK